jgi:segregation and condensation protein A
MSDNYRINLEIFEGPMDLLLYLIKKNDVDIYDIPIAFITDEYLKYINALKVLNIDFASEFLEMAAELAHIKSKMLLPSDNLGEEEEDVDPRADLVRRLLEYQRYKEAATALSEGKVLYRDVFTASVPKDDGAPKDETVFIEGNPFLLFEAFNEMLAKAPKDMVKKAPSLDRISVGQRIMQIIEKIRFGQTVPLTDLIPEPYEKHIIVATFLALLEMAIMKMIKVYQAGRFEPIYLTGTIKEASIEDVKRLIETREDKVVEVTDGTE